MDIVILEMRVYAIYEKNRRVIVLSVFVNLASLAVCVLQLNGDSCQYHFCSLSHNIAFH